MKYIRTKKGVYKIYDTHNGATNHWGYKVNENLIMLLDKESIKNNKTADTIEELCDEFIVISDNCKRPIISALPFNELQLYAKGRTKYATCYGAIWADKGLIYVAKMNDKGELELL